jgi:two-component system response regulator RegA
MNAEPHHGTLLLVEDDAVFSSVMGRALRRRGFEVVVAAGVDAALAQARQTAPRYAVVDLKLGGDNGLELIPVLRRGWPGMRILLMTCYASIATAVEAIKRGADDYLAKPVDADAVARSLLDATADVAANTADAEVADTPLQLRRLEWEHIQRTLLECGGNISETARRLGMHRRTLQRKLEKHPVRERSKD